MKLRDHLRVPWVLEACSLEGPGGEWTNRVSYPELGDCAVEGKSIEAIMDEIERLRARTILDRLRRGIVVRSPRAPDESVDPGETLARLGLIAEFEDLLDLDEADLRIASSDRGGKREDGEDAARG